eukprot:s393_g20.t1
MHYFLRSILIYLIFLSYYTVIAAASETTACPGKSKLAPPPIRREAADFGAAQLCPEGPEPSSFERRQFCEKNQTGNGFKESSSLEMQLLHGAHERFSQCMLEVRKEVVQVRRHYVCSNQQGKNQNKGKNQQKKSKGKGKGGQKWPHQIQDEEEDQYLPPSTRWLNPPSVPTPTEQAAGSGAVLPTALQPFSKTRAERDKEEAELNSLRQLRDTLKAKPQNELTEDVKKAIQVAEQHARKEDAKTHRSLVDQLQKARKSLGEVEEQWNAFRVQWSTYLDQATKLWKSHVENYELGETKWSQRRQEAVQHLHRVRARLHEVHVRTMSTDGAYQDVNLQHAQAALDDAMLIEEQDLSEDQEVLAQAKEKLIGIVEQVRTNIEARVKKRDRSVPRAEEIQESEDEAAGKRSRDSN